MAMASATSGNYRYQLLEEGPGRPALAPRVTVLCPTGNAGRGLGVGAWGWQFTLPASKQVHDFYFHGDAGLTWYPRVKSIDSRSAGAATAPDVTLTSPYIAGSTVYRLKPMFNLMLESGHMAGRRGRMATVDVGLTVLAGFRTGWNIGDAQWHRRPCAALHVQRRHDLALACSPTRQLRSEGRSRKAGDDGGDPWQGHPPVRRP